MATRTYIVALISLGVGITAGLCIHALLPEPKKIPGFQERESSSQYPYINPLIFSEVAQKEEFTEFNPLIKQVQDYIQKAQSSSQASQVSLYVRDLNSGHWTGVNEEALYAPASMLKVALMITYLKQAENNPAILDKKIVFSGNEESEQVYKPQHPLEQGKEYTVRQLISNMIVESSNTSNQLLLKNIDQNNLIKTYQDLGLPIPTATSSDFLSAKEYSRVFRTLYSSTYLTRISSNSALELLAHAEFNQGIVSGVPTSTVVAHKFGERTTDTERELHDCGIVYLPEHPYFICVMTKGTSYDNLEKTISSISSLTYSAMEHLDRSSMPN